VFIFYFSVEMFILTWVPLQINVLLHGKGDNQNIHVQNVKEELPLVVKHYAVIVVNSGLI
jgi:hypothetical protein